MSGATISNYLKNNSNVTLLRKSRTGLVIHFESEIDRLVYHLYEVKLVPFPAFYYLHSLHRQHPTDCNVVVVSTLYFITTRVHTTPNLHLSYTGAYSPRFLISILDILSGTSGQSVRLLRGKLQAFPSNRCSVGVASVQDNYPIY